MPSPSPASREGWFHERCLEIERIPNNRARGEAFEDLTVEVFQTIYGVHDAHRATSTSAGYYVDLDGVRRALPDIYIPSLNARIDCKFKDRYSTGDLAIRLSGQHFLETGCNKRHFDDYIAVCNRQSETGVLFFAHKDPGFEDRWVLRWDLMSRLQDELVRGRPGRVWDGVNEGTKNKVSEPLCLWPLSSFRRGLHSICTPFRSFWTHLRS